MLFFIAIQLHVLLNKKLSSIKNSFAQALIKVNQMYAGKQESTIMRLLYLKICVIYGFLKTNQMSSHHCFSYKINQFNQQKLWYFSELQTPPISVPLQMQQSSIKRSFSGLGNKKLGQKVGGVKGGILYFLKLYLQKPTKKKRTPAQRNKINPKERPK